MFQRGKKPEGKKRNSITSSGLSDSLKNEKGEAGAIFIEGRERRIKRGKLKGSLRKVTAFDGSLSVGL